MKIILYHGAPSDAHDRQDLPEGRPQQEMRTYEFLDRAGISYIRADHDRAMTMEDCAAAQEVLGAPICKNLFLCNRQKTDFYLLLMPGGKPFKTKEITGQIGCSRLSFGPEEYMWDYMNCHQGSASVLGLMNDHGGKVRLLADEDLKENEYLGAHPCNNTSTLKLRSEDVFGRFLELTGHDVTWVKLGIPAAGQGKELL